MSMRPQLPKLSDGKAALDEYERALAAWEQTPEGIAETQRIEEERRREQAEAGAAFEAHRSTCAEKLFGAIGMPPRALAVASGHLDTTESLAAVDDARDMLVLSGAPGCGKTVAAAAWLVGFVRDKANWKPDGFDDKTPRFRWHRPVWVTAARLARWERYDEEKMDELLKTPRLVVDDLGGEYMDKGGFYASLLDEIVNERQAASRPTVLTTNLDAEAFKARYGERIVDRIREGGRFVACGNKSMRRKAS